MNRLRDKFRRSHADEQLDREIAFHVDELTRDNIGRGMTSTEARRQAVLQFGGAEQVKQQLREVHLSAVIEGFGANLRSAMRFIRRAPSFAFAVIMTLALGIGANSAVFSAIDAILLRPLPFPHGGELIRFHQRDFKHKNPETFVAPLRLEDWNRMNSSFQSISGYYTGDATLTSGLPSGEGQRGVRGSALSSTVGYFASTGPRLQRRRMEVRRTQRRAD